MSLQNEFRQVLPSEGELILAEERVAHEESRRVSSRRKVLFAALAAAVLVVVVVAAWLIHSRAPLETAVLDLRNITRGYDTSPSSAVALRRHTRHLRIFLSAQNPPGEYQVGVFDPDNRNSPLMTSPASSTREGDSIVLQVPMVIKNLQPGLYLIGIRHDQLEWAYYTIRID